MNPVLSVFKSVNNLAHGWQVAATVAVGGCIFCLSWWLSTQGWLEMGATALTFFGMQIVRMSGMSVAKRAPREFAKTASTIDTARQEFGDWIANNRLLANCLLAVIFTGMFLAGRVAASGLMTLIASPLLAIALGLAVTAAVISPVLVKAVCEAFTRKEDES